MSGCLPRSERLVRLALWPSALGGVLGLLGLLGSVLDIERLVGLIPCRPRMALGTALGIVLAALGVVLQQAHGGGRARLASSRAIGAAVALIGVVVSIEHAFDPGMWVDWQFKGLHPLQPHPGRPSPFAAISLTALGGALMLFGVERRIATTARETLCFIATGVALASLIGHAFGAGEIDEIGGSPALGIAVSSAIALTALGFAAWLAAPQAGLLRLATAPGPGGVLLRRLGTTAVLAVPVLGGLFLAFVETIGLGDQPLLFALGSVLTVVFSLALLATTADVLERSDEEAEAARQRARELFERAPEGIFIADLAGHYTDVNTAGCRLLDVKRAEILQKSIGDLVPPDDVSRLRPERDLMHDGAVQTVQSKLRRSDGSYASVEVTSNIVPGSRWLSFVHDISKRLELERTLLESRDFLQRVLESSTAYGIVAEDLDQNVVLWNEGARQAFGYELDAIRGKPSKVLVADGQLGRWETLHANGLTRGTAEGNIQARRRDGSTFAAHMVCTRRLGSDHAPAGLLIVTSDLTVEQRYLAEQEFLSRVGVELAECLEWRETLSRVTELARSFLGDIAIVDVVHEHTPRRQIVLDRSADQEFAREAMRLGAPRGEAHPVSIVIKTRQPMLLSELTPEGMARISTSDEQLRLLNAAQITSGMVVPLIARGQLLAVLSIAARNGSRRYTADDMRLAMELARRAALTLDNVQLFHESRLQAAVTTNLAEGAILVRAADSTIVYANLRAEGLFGYAPRELLCRDMSTLHAKSEDTNASPSARIAEQLDHADAWHDELECLRKDGSPFWCAVSASNFDHTEHGRVWIAVYTDITERKRLEQQTTQALVEKEVLLKEIHHRVKNNLQVICSLFSLQRSRTHNAALRSLLDESRTRVESIALVHEQLYRSTDVAAIDFSQYLRRLVGSIRSGYGAEAPEIEVHAPNVVLDVEHAVPCALLVCELVSNSLKHAFGSRAGRVWVRAERDENGYCDLDIGDDGRGLPADLDWTKTRSLGLRLVQGFARQLRASVVVERSGGTRFRLRFHCRNGNNAKPRERLAAAAAR